MANALDSLRILAGGPGRRVLPQQDFQFAGAVPTQGELSSPYEQEQGARAARADASDHARIAETEALNSEMNSYSRPDVAARREEDFGRKMALEGEPARVAGEANVRATTEAGRARGLSDLFRLQVGNEGKSALQAQKDAAMAERQAATGQGVGLRQRLNALQTGKAHAKQPGGLMGFFGGNKAADEAEIASLLAQLQGGGSAGEAASTGGPQAGDVKTFPNGTRAVFDGQGWVRQ